MSTDFSPDVVLTGGPAYEPTHGFIVEVQQARSHEKCKKAARYAAALWLQLDCPVFVLFFCPDEDTAAYYAKPCTTPLDHYVSRPRALSPSQVPVITDPEHMAATPGVGTLSLAFHGRRPEVREAFVRGMSTLPSDLWLKYYLWGYSLSPKDIGTLLEDLVRTADMPIYSPLAKELLAEGEAQGEAKGEADAVLTILDARGLQPTTEQRNEISACTDLAQLRAWVRSAVTVASVADLFA